jgi:hypothetical protein
VDCDEDPIRLPAEDADMRVRISTLAARAVLPPQAKGDGPTYLPGELGRAHRPRGGVGQGPQPELLGLVVRRVQNRGYLMDVG